MKHEGQSPKEYPAEPSMNHKHHVDSGIGKGLPVIGSGLVDIPREGTEKCNTDGGSGSGVIQDAIWMDGGVGTFQG